MAIIIPAPIARSYAELETLISQIKPMTDVVQLDITDGKFAGEPSWPYTETGEITVLPPGMHYELHLMVEEPLALALSGARAGAERILVHVEALEDIGAFIKDFREGAPQTELYFSLNMETNTSAIEPYLNHVDGVQFMCIAHIGAHGAAFDMRVVEKIKNFHERFPEVSIEVDGGITAEHIPRLQQVGVERFALWSAIFAKNDPAAAYRALTAL